MLFWRPEYKTYTWFTEGSHLNERTIINVCPVEARIVKGKDFDFSVAY
jgi:hypothetical protein